MKERIQEKLNAHVEKVLAKEEISNDEYYLLLGVMQRTEIEEKTKAEAEKREKTNEQYNEHMQALFKIFNEK